MKLHLLTVGILAYRTPPFPNQADSLPNTQTQPYPNAQDKTTCDVKPQPIPFRRDTPERPEKNRRPQCQAAMLNCLMWAKDGNGVMACQTAWTKCVTTSDIVQFPHGEWVF